MAASMLRQLNGVFFLMVFLLLGEARYAEFVRDDIPEQIHASTVELSTPNGETGMGIVVNATQGEKGVIVLTAGHAVEGAARLSVRFSNGEIRQGQVLHLNTE